MNRKNQIKRIKRQIEDAKLELNKVHESHLKTSETLKMTENQGNLLQGIEKNTGRREGIEPIKKVFNYVLLLVTPFFKDTKWLEIAAFFIGV